MTAISYVEQYILHISICDVLAVEERFLLRGLAAQFCRQ